jgi:hypothetical protein
MNIYATKKTFGGQRASLGRPVIVSDDSEGRIVPGTITRIGGTTDEPVLTITSLYDGCDVENIVFVETTTEEEVARIPPYSWTWPVLV